MAMVATTRRMGTTTGEDATDNTATDRTADGSGTTTTQADGEQISQEGSRDGAADPEEASEKSMDEDEEHDNGETEPKTPFETLTQTCVAPRSNKVKLNGNLRPYFIGEKYTRKYCTHLIFPV